MKTIQSMNHCLSQTADSLRLTRSSSPCRQTSAPKVQSSSHHRARILEALFAFLFVVAPFLSLTPAARGGVVFSSGYYDLSPAASNGGPALPAPWIGSPNTTFYGSSNDQSAAVASDPDLAAILIRNTGTTSVTLSALSLSPYGMDVLARATAPSGNLPAGSVTLLPGQSYIFAVGDGSDEGLTGQSINFTLNGSNYSFADAKTALAPDGVLAGNMPELGNDDETQPWAQFASIPAPADFNGDGRPDFVLFNPTNLKTAIWYLTGPTYTGGAFGPTLVSGYQLVSVGDFNLDGHPDYLLFNPGTLRTAIWYLNGINHTGGDFGPTLTAGWSIAGTADFNGDGNLDYLLFNASTRQTAIWYLNGPAYVSSTLGPVLPAGWTVAGVADFNGDGKPDLALFNAGTRQTAIWYMNNASHTAGALGPTLPAGWVLQGVADFNGDGHPDFVLVNASTRQTAIWYLNGVSYTGGAFGPTLAAGYDLAAP